jgi:hypothetical protein
MDSDHPLHYAINSQKGNRLKRGKSWMGQAEEAVRLVCLPEEAIRLVCPHGEAMRLVCPPEEIALGEEWLMMPQLLCTTFSVIITLGRSCRLENPVAVETEVQALIFENFSDKSAH